MVRVEQPARGQGREVLTAAAREILAERGYHGTSIREIARRAGLSLSALYYWHEGKQDLLADVLLASRHDYLRVCDAALADVAQRDAATRLVALVTATVGHRVRHRQENVIGAREWRHLASDNIERLEQLGAEATARWRGVIAAGVDSAEFACPHPDDARRAIEAACNAIAQWYDPDGAVPPDELAERYATIALRIVDHRGTGGRRKS